MNEPNFDLTLDEWNIVESARANLDQANNQLNQQLLVLDGLIARLAIQHKVNQVDYALNFDTHKFEPRPQPPALALVEKE